MRTSTLYLCATIFCAHTTFILFVTSLKPHEPVYVMFTPYAIWGAIYAFWGACFLLAMIIFLVLWRNTRDRENAEDRINAKLGVIMKAFKLSLPERRHRRRSW